MQIMGIALKDIPNSVKSGIFFLYTGWILLLVAVYSYYLRDFFSRIFICGCLICFFVTKFKNWARWICMLFNIMAAVYCAFFAWMFYHGKADMDAGAAYIAVALLFFVSTYFLAMPETARFYKAHSEKKDETNAK